jgi:hypothetical protein
MKDRKKAAYTIKSSKLPGPTPIERLIKARGIVGKTAIRNFTKKELAEEKAWHKRMDKLMKGLQYNEDLPDRAVPVFDIIDPRWQDIDIGDPTSEPSPTAAERAERRAIAIKAGQDACDLLNKFYRLGKYAPHR